MIEITSRTGSGPARNIKIIGIGGAGANVLDRLALDGVAPALLIAANTEAQALAASVAGKKIQLGLDATRGLGTGGDPELGRCAAEEAASEIRAAVDGADAVFIIAGLGGGTGSGATPLVAELARETGALVIAVVTLPFGFEGKRRAGQAAEALGALQQHADAVVCFENDRMGETVPPRAGIQTAFVTADQTLSQCILAIGALLNRTGLIHLGMDDLTAVLREAGARCLFGYGEAEGSNRVFDALASALKNPLMDKGRILRDCGTVLVQVSGGSDLTLDEVQLLMEELNRHVHEQARILFGAAVDSSLEGRVAVTLMSSIGEGHTVVSKSANPFARAEAVSRPPVAALRRAPIPAVPEPEPDPEEVEEVEEVPTPAAAQEMEPEIPSARVAEEVESAEIGEAFELDGDLPLPEPKEEPVVEPEPVFPRMEKPRGLRTATQQASLFGEEPAAPVERIAPPVPGRMLQRPFPPRPAAAPIPPVVAAPAPARPATPVPVPVEEPKRKTVPVFETKPEPAMPAPPPNPEPNVAPRPQIVSRRPTPAPRLPELIPAEEMASHAPAKAPLQEVMEFEPVTRGRFEKSEPTIVDGQDLDVPTYLRRRVKLR